MDARQIKIENIYGEVHYMHIKPESSLTKFPKGGWTELNAIMTKAAMECVEVINEQIEMYKRVE